MGINKHILKRIEVLDRCFADTTRRYFIEDLHEKCNDALYEYAGVGISIRSVQDDITLMETNPDWEVELERKKEGKRVYFRYKNPDYSIFKRTISPKEAHQLKEAISMLNRFKGMPQFEWMEEMKARLESSFGLTDHADKAVSFDSNPYLVGLKEHFTPLFNAIVNKRVLRVNYQAFGREAREFTLHPYYLKQYKNRWFLFAMNEENGLIINIAIDRIINIKECKIEYQATETDFEEYFKDIVGVTKPQEGELQKIKLKVGESTLPYIITKPLHRSQKQNEVEKNIIELEVYDNYELEANIFYYGEAIEVLEPESLRNKMKERAEKLYLRYK